MEDDSEKNLDDELQEVPQTKSQWTPRQNAVMLESKLEETVQNIFDAGGEDYPRWTAIGYLRDSVSLLRAVRYFPERALGCRRIIDNMLQSLELLDQSGVDFHKAISSLQSAIEIASLHGLTIDGYDLSPGWRRQSDRHGPSI